MIGVGALAINSLFDSFFVGFPKAAVAGKLLLGGVFEFEETGTVVTLMRNVTKVPNPLLQLVPNVFLLLRGVHMCLGIEFLLG